MEAFLTSLGIVFVAELGDKTQFLSLYLAATYRRPLAVLAGIVVATLASNIVAALFGRVVGHYLTPSILRWVLVVSFVGFAVWALLPEDDEPTRAERAGHGAFIGTLVSFLLAELGDKTQIVTIALAARFTSIAMVVAGATLGMILANLPALLGGHYFARRIPTRVASYVAAAIFLAQAVLTYLGIERF